MPYDFERALNYCPRLMDGWQYKAAFVIQLWEETNVAAGRVEGRIEHIASTRAARFNSLDELVSFIASVLTEVRSAEQ
jgi:hypothetical protein